MLPYLLTLTGIICVLSQSPHAEEQLHLSESRSTTASINSIPGGTSFNFCPESSIDTDLFTVERIYWDPDPPRISETQKLLINGVFAVPIPQDAVATAEVHIPAWHFPDSPPCNFTTTGPFCDSCNYIYQTDDDRGLHKVCDGVVGCNSSGPDTGSAVLVHEDFLFWPLPEGEYYVKLDVMMPNQEDEARESRVFCLEGTASLNY